jgi:Mce-associated membrane protein
MRRLATNRINGLLAALVLALGVALGVVVTRDEAPAASTSSSTAAYDQVTAAASEQVTAFLDIDHETVDEQLQEVLDGATGEFKEQFAAQVDSIKAQTEEQQSTAGATILKVGISTLTPESATVFVAANTDITSKATEGESRTVPWRIQLDLVKEGERWLTAGLQFVN